MTHRFLLGFILIAPACLPGCFPEIWGGPYKSDRDGDGGSASSIGGSGTGGEVTSIGGMAGTGGSTVSTSSTGTGGAGGGCPGSEELCNSACTNTQTNILHCGACNNACLNTTQVSCVAGECNGPCGPVPQTDYAPCYYGLTIDPGEETYHVGFAGAVVPSGADITQIWADPMHNPNSCTGTPCIGGNSVNVLDVSTQNAFMPDIGALASGTSVYFEPGLHSNVVTASDGGLACGDTTCSGSAILYLDGVEIGWVAGSVATGELSLETHYNAPRLDIKWVVP